jgi:hypothetical protein
MQLPRQPDTLAAAALLSIQLHGYHSCCGLLQSSWGLSSWRSPLPVSRSHTLTVPLAAPAPTLFSAGSNVTHSTGEFSPTRVCKHWSKQQYGCINSTVIDELLCCTPSSDLGGNCGAAGEVAVQDELFALLLQRTTNRPGQQPTWTTWGCPIRHNLTCLSSPPVASTPAVFLPILRQFTAPLWATNSSAADIVTCEALLHRIQSTSASAWAG